MASRWQYPVPWLAVALGLGLATPAAADRANEPLGVTLGVEVGYGRTGDSGNLYGAGWGRNLLLSIQSIELRYFENYDLDDRTGTYDGVGQAEGRMGISSAAYRLRIMQMGRIRWRGLLGVAWLRRPSLRFDEDEISSDYKLRTQHGIGLLAGGGPAVSVGRFFVGADLRVYLTKWSDISGGIRVVPGEDGMPVTEEIASSPGGLPVTFNLTVGVEL